MRMIRYSLDSTLTTLFSTELPIGLKESVAVTFNGAANGTKHQSTPVPKISDVLGAALPKIGTYNDLDNRKQVVALIDDVSLMHDFNRNIFNK